MDHGFESSGRGLAPRGRMAVCAALLLGLLAGCSAAPSGGAGDAPGRAEAPSDPVVAFAAAATPGQTAVVQTPQGAQAARLARAYFAASGRECREVVVGSGLQERSRLLCRDGQRWADARPLLRGGAATQ